VVRGEAKESTKVAIKVATKVCYRRGRQMAGSLDHIQPQARCSTERKTVTEKLHTRIARITTNFTEENKGNEERANDRIMWSG